MNNFEWQFDPAFLNKVLSQEGRTTNQSISTNITAFVKNLVQELNQKSTNGVIPSSILPGSDINEFGELLALIVDKKQEYEGIEPRDRLEVREKYSDLKIERDTLAWSLKKRKPGLFASGKVGNDHVQEYSAHLRGVFDDPYNPGHSIIALGQKMDNWVDLCIYSADAQSANSRAIWLEHTLDQARWIFQYNGFERVLFDERDGDTFEEMAGNRFHGRHLVYFVRSEKIVLHRVALLRKLIFDLCLVPLGQRVGDSANVSFKSVLTT